MYLQLAENSNRNFNYGGFSQKKKSFKKINPSDNVNPYIYVPDPSGQSEGIYIREDYFDYMTPFEWRQFMVQLAPHQPEVEQGAMSEGQFMNDRASRKAKREERQAKRKQKSDDKHAKKEAKTRLKNARADAKKNGKGGDVLGSVIDGVKSIFGKGGDDTSTAPDNSAPDNAPDNSKPDKSESMFSNPLVLAGIGVALAGGIYFATKK